MPYWYLPHIFHTFSQFDFGVYSLMPVCTAQYAELGLISIMPFVGIRTVFVLRLSFAVSKPKEILSLSTGNQPLEKIIIHKV